MFVERPLHPYFRTILHPKKREKSAVIYDTFTLLSRPAISG